MDNDFFGEYACNYLPAINSVQIQALIKKANDEWSQESAEPNGNRVTKVTFKPDDELVSITCFNGKLQ